MVLVICVTGAYSTVVVTRNAAAAAVLVYGMVLKVTLLPGGDTVSMRFFICRQVAGVSA